MANNLTGNYDAVLLIRVAKINAILGTLHQNGSDEDSSPTFPHSVTTRLGDPPKIVRPPLAEVADFFNATLQKSGGNGDGPNPGLAVLDVAPPGTAKALRAAFDDLQAARAEVISPPPGPTVRGTVRAQISAPSISLPVGTTSEVTVQVHARANYKPDPNTLALPEPAHGEVQVTYSVLVKPLPHYGSPRKILEVNVPQDDAKIQFHPAPGVNLSPIDLAQLLTQIRKLVRQGIEPVNTQLPNDFPFRQFKELGAGQTMALPLSLTTGVEPPNALGTVTQNFLNDDFSIGVSREFVERQLKPTLDQLKQFRHSFSIRISFGLFSVGLTTYHISVTSVALAWNAGSLDLVLKVNATASLAPNYDVTIRQRLALSLNASSQTVLLGASGDPQISVSGTGGSFIKSRVRDAFIPVRDAQLPGAQDFINARLTGDGGAAATINQGLRSIDDSSGARFSGLRVTPDGLILDGRLTTKPRSAPSVAFEETRDGTAFTALESWIPGGRIDRFEWSWIMQNPTSIWGQHVGTRTEDHNFLLPKPQPAPGPMRDILGDVCLRVSGRRIDSSGQEVAVSAGRMCSVSIPEVAWRMPASIETLVLPVWMPGVAAEVVLDEAIAAHVNILTDQPPTPARTANSVVHFPDLRTDQPLTALGKALATVPRKSGPLLVIVVLPAGTFKGTRRDLEAKLGSLAEEFPGRLLLTEDSTGGWGRSFGASKLPATYLLNDRGEFVWKQEGVLDGEALTRAMNEFFVSGRAPAFRRLRLATPMCSPISRTAFTDDAGQRLTLKKLRGRPVLLNFWQSWSPPSLRELVRLQSLQEKGDEDAPVIVAVNGGEKCEVLSEIRRRFGLTYAIAHDPDRLLARQFGIECWPTTVSIDAEGRVNGVQFGEVTTCSPASPLGR